MSGRIATVDFGPVEAEQLVAAPCQEKPVGVEPRFRLAHQQVVERPPALVGQSGKRAGVDREPIGLVDPDALALQPALEQVRAIAA